MYLCTLECFIKAIKTEEKGDMKLREVLIRGYKSIDYENPVKLSLGDISILLGANGAGKSNIISFFRMLSYMMNKSFGRYVEMVGTANSLLHYGIKKTPVLSGTCGVEHLKKMYPLSKKACSKLTRDLMLAGNPELINNDPNTSPSKRIIQAIEGDKKKNISIIRL